MIIIKDSEPYNVEIKQILTLTVNEVINKSKNEKELLKLSGTAFEKVVCDTLNSMSAGTSFLGKFEQSTAHAFPDIFAKILENNWFGIEVKTSQSDWKCFGNSIFETTRIGNLDDRIYVFFGKFSKSDLECKWARYDECIDNINITHSPRYQINMDVKDNPINSVFSKMGISYIDFAKSNVSNRMEHVRKYKRKGLGQNAALWWLPDSDDLNNIDEQKLIIKLFASLEKTKKAEIRSTAIMFFPEVFSNRNDKYTKIPTWLASQYGVVMGNIRDLFSAGGQGKIDFNGKLYKLPRVCIHLDNCVNQIKQALAIADQEDLRDNWNLSDDMIFLDFDEKLDYWIKSVEHNLYELKGVPNNFPIKAWLSYLFK